MKPNNDGMKFNKKQRGATVIEYTLVAALVSIAALSALKAVGSNVSDTLGSVATALEDKPSPAPVE